MGRIMRDHSTRYFFAVSALSGVLVMALAGPADALSKLEEKCSSQLGKAAAKITKVASKEISKCRDADISGKLVGSCPNAENTAKITSTADKATSKAIRFCQSVCAASNSITCVATSQCPPSANQGFPEQCSAGAANEPFDMGNIGFPGPVCEGLLGDAVDEPEDIGDCTDTVTQLAVGNLIDSIYGSIANVSAISSDAGKCLSGMAKATTKLTATTVKQVAKCRDAIAAGKASGDPAACATSDPKVEAKIAKIAAKVDKIVNAKCEVGHLAVLDICNLGVGGVATLDDAIACLTEAGQQVGDSTLLPGERAYSPLTVIEAAYPAAPGCGDGIVNQLPNAQLILGEECDGGDDAACPGECLPPGDVFECTCGDRMRVRTFATAQYLDPRTDSDAGWTGNSHNQTIAHLSGMVLDLTDCDCDEFTDADCTGTSADPVCTATGTQIPRCSWDVAGTTSRCDDWGTDDDDMTGGPHNAGEVDEDEDCAICDAFAVNAGAACANGDDCQSQCYDGGGSPTGPCTTQADCGAGEICRGLCDTSPVCVHTANGGPLSVSSTGTSVCTTNAFRTSVTGTRNIVTGEHELNFELFSKQHLGEDNARPCPVCGGFCVGGANDSFVCEGRCSVTTLDRCRFDTDCPGGETCERDSPDCPGGFCQLDLICGGLGDNEVVGDSCAIEYTDPFFGSMSLDCPPSNIRNITGRGFEILHTPTTSETITYDFPLPCDPPLQLLDCACPSDGGPSTKPNGCQNACNAAGPNFGIGCANGNSQGSGSLCAAGANVGKVCDEDSDCPGSSCSDNPMHCFGDPAFERCSCSTNADCGVGTCGDECPGGQCTLLCLSDPGDPEDGLCAAAPPTFQCSGAAHLGCLEAQATGGCAATCEISGDPCTSDAGCDPDERCAGPCLLAEACEAGPDGVLGNDDDRPGAGICVEAARSCILDPLVVEGGDIYNGNGSPTDNYRVSFWCFGSSFSGAVNETAGFGGPGVLREAGVNVVNRTSTP
jgi:hypothetical protein